MKFCKKNVIFSVILISCMFLMSLINSYLASIELSNKLLALILTLFFVIFPFLLGILLKLIVNNKHSALLIIILSTTISSIGDVIFLGESFIIELLSKVLVIPTTMIYYYITFSIIQRQNKVVPIIISIILSFFIAFGFWWSNLLFLTLAK